jgi:hypothetical protein
VLRKYCAGLGLPDEDADFIDDRWNSGGFKSKKRKIRDWQAYIRNLKRGGWTPSTRGTRKTKRQPIDPRI